MTQQLRVLAAFVKDHGWFPIPVPFLAFQGSVYTWYTCIHVGKYLEIKR